MTIETSDVIIENEEEISEDIIRCLNCLYSTIEGTCPLDREFGLSIECIDKPLQIAKNLYVLDVIEKTEIYEPRIKVADIAFELNDEKLIPHIKIEKNEDYEEEQEAYGEEDEEEW